MGSGPFAARADAQLRRTLGKERLKKAARRERARRFVVMHVISAVLLLLLAAPLWIGLLLFFFAR